MSPLRSVLIDALSVVLLSTNNLLMVEDCGSLECIEKEYTSTTDDVMIKVLIRMRCLQRIIPMQKQMEEKKAMTAAGEEEDGEDNAMDEEKAKVAAS